jgi:hypothetical protein
MTGNSVSHGRTPAVPAFDLPRPAGPRTDAAFGRVFSADDSGHDVGPEQGPQAGNSFSASNRPADPLQREAWRYTQGRGPDATSASAPVAKGVRRMMYWCKDSCRVVMQKGELDVRS